MFNIYVLILCFVILLQGFFVILSKNAVTSVLFLISVYVFTAVLFLIIGAEFLALILVIVYVGAVSILFLFVVMMLNLRVSETYHTLMNYIPIGFFIAFLFVLEFVYVISIEFGFGVFTNYSNFVDLFNFIVPYITKSNFLLIGEALFTLIHTF